MKAKALFSFLLFLLVLSPAIRVSAQTQLPVCSGTGAGQGYGASFSGQGLIYALGVNDTIYRIDPNVSSVPVATSITVPAGADALAVSANLNGGTVTPTYYTTLSVGLTKYLHYYNGFTWVNTGTVMNSDHIAGGGGYVFGLDCGSGFVFRTDGVSAPAFVANVGTGGTCDISADCNGNFYIIDQTDSTFTKYSFNGTVLFQDKLEGNFAAAGGGLAVIGPKVYYDGADGILYEGLINAPASLATVTFQPMAGSPFTTIPMTDFGSCGANGVGAGIFASDSIKLCGPQKSLQLIATPGNGSPNWRVLSGPHTITPGSTGNNYATLSNLGGGTTIILHDDPDCAGANTLIDTTVIMVANAKVNAGKDTTYITCGERIRDTLNATLSDTSGNIQYVYNWTPLSEIQAGTETTLTPIIFPNKTTSFILNVTTANKCSFKDTIVVKIVDSTPVADFQYLIKLGCESDTVRFFNTSTGGIDSFAWNFRDSVGNNGQWIYSNAVAPTHVFLQHGFYPVTLLVKNDYCYDTINKQLDLSHPLDAKFDVDTPAACSDKVFVFTDRSITPNRPGYPGFKPAIWTYYFGDGSKSNLSSPTHKFPKAGTYTVMLVIQDFLGCTDTAWRTIIVDSLPYVKINLKDKEICQGQAVHLQADYLRIGNTSISFDMGDGTMFNNQPELNYVYSKPGTYNIVLTAKYRYCPDATITQTITVRPFPGVDIGPDTTLCPNGAPIMLSDRINPGNAEARYIWNTGETTPAIAAGGLGTYWAQVTIGNCSAADSINIIKDCFLDIPNSFTPNGDGNNDYFLPRQFLSRSANAFKMSIFNRWGQVIFQTTAIDGRGWDGKFNGVDQPQGVYVYKIDVSFANGATEHYTGNLTLLR